MARTKVYIDRGLKLPEEFLKNLGDADLCESCALGKPTFSFSYVPQTRAEKKGKLWYFDVSGGGELAPSLKYKNRYIYLFVDSASRMYFNYYTKTTDDRITLQILKKFEEDVLSTLDLDADEITFMQSDNGQLNSTGVKSWLRKRRIFSKFISPYHPNMNGFVERAFRSIKDLSRCMLSAAGLPDPYWEKATSHAVLLRNTMPNQSKEGYVREAYYLWYGLTYDYSRLRVWGSRAYALNHIRGKDFGERSVPGIFVGMKPDNPITYDYEIYLPTKDKFITSGDVMFCEHVDRSEPERLLPPLLTLPSGSVELDVNDFQNLVDTIHLDNDEGVQYRVVKVYKSRGVAVVDRVLYNANNPRAIGGTLDNVFLDNVNRILDHTW